ncbi:MAG: hypothetical protein Q9218_003313 [Villophora microphyllina]
MHLLTLSLAFLPSILALSPSSTPTPTTNEAPHPAILIVQTPPPQPQLPYLELRHLNLEKRQAVAAAGAPAAAAAGAAQQPAGGAAAPAAAPAAVPAAAPAAAAAPAPAAGGLVGAHGDVPIAAGPATALTTAPAPKIGSIGMGTLTGKVGVVKTAEAQSKAGIPIKDVRFGTLGTVIGVVTTILLGMGIACALRQWSLDFEGNTKRITDSILEAKKKGAKIRVGSELEICGYECADHFKEADLQLHCWEMLEKILQDDTLHDILLDIGMPVQHRNVLYNCRIIALDGKILLIRPKQSLAADGNYYETRFFTPWLKPQQTEQYHLPRRIQKIQGATHVTFGDAVISTPDTCLAAETCEELFTPSAPHTPMGLDGVEIFTNSSGSHFTLRKLSLRLQLIQEATRKNGGIYIYSNQQGCGGDRLYFDASPMVLVNGEIVAQGSQFSLREVEVVVAMIDLEDVRAYRASNSRCFQASMSTAKYERIQTPFALSSEENLDLRRGPSPPIQPRIHSPEEEIALCAACYLWDYLRRSSTAGYLVPLSGGIDSCATAVLVYSMCRLVIKEIKDGNDQVIADVKRLARFSDHLPETAQELCNQIFHTIYLGMARQSSKDTRQRAKDLAEAIGAYHVNLDIDEVYEAQRNLIVNALNFEPKFKVEGGTTAENLVLQNIQARSRMVTAYEFAQTLPIARQHPGGGSLLVLGSANVGESLRGYLTNSADINPIGAIDKQDLKRLIAWAEIEFEYGSWAFKKIDDEVEKLEKLRSKARLHVVVWYLWLSVTVTFLAIRAFHPQMQKVLARPALQRKIPLIKRNLTIGACVMVSWIALLYAIIMGIWWHRLQEYFVGRSAAGGIKNGGNTLAAVALTGHLCDVTMGMALIPISRHSALASFFQLSVSTTLTLHMLSAYTLFALVLIHAFLYVSWVSLINSLAEKARMVIPVLNPTYLYHETWPGNDTSLGVWRASLVFTGFFAVVVMAAIAITTLPQLRRKHFNLFYFTHLFSILMVIVICLHASTMFYCTAPGLAMWCLDWSMRLGELKAAFPGKISTFGNGWYCASSRREIHPFTTITHLATADAITPPESPEIMIQFLFRKAGTVTNPRKAPTRLLTKCFRGSEEPKKSAEWTEKLANSLHPTTIERDHDHMKGQKHHMQTSSDVSLRLEGPYFSPADPSRYDAVVCLVAGTGVSGAIAIAGTFNALQSLLVTGKSVSSSDARPRSTWRKCVIAWSIRETDYADLPGLQETSNLSVQVCLTGPGRPRQNIQDIMTETRKNIGPDASIWTYISGPKGFIENAKTICKAMPHVDIFAADWEV